MYRFFFLASIVLLGCNVQSQPYEEEDKIRIPEKISVEIPEALDSDTNNTLSKKEKIRVDRIEELNSGYRLVKAYVSNVKEIVNEMNSNLFIGNEVIDEIVSYCQKIPKEKICTIAAQNMSFVVDQKIIDRLRLLIPNNFAYQDANTLIGERLFLGTIEFVKHDSNATHDYSLNMDMSEVMGRIKFYDPKDLPKIIQKINWSKNRKRIFTSISTEYSDGRKYPWTLNYNDEVDKEENMHLHDSIKGSEMEAGSTHVFSLTNQYGTNKDYIVYFNSIEEQLILNRLAQTKRSSYVKLTEEFDYHKFTSTKETSTSFYKVNAEEVFDKLGKAFATTYCDSVSLECNLYDSTTWYTDSENDLIFEPLKDVTLEELKIVGGNLLDGEYILLPPQYNFKDKSIKEVLDSSVGEFAVLKTFRQGVIYDEEYVNKLGNLQILYSLYNNNLDEAFQEKKLEFFELVSVVNRPSLNLWSKD